MTHPRAAASPCRLRVFSLGGTIAMGARGADGVTPNLDAADIVKGLGSGFDVDAVAFRRVPSMDLGFADVADLAGAIMAAFAEGVTGVVVTQGTDSLEECAFLLDLFLPPGRPVVVTGAMRNPTLPGADGPSNVVSAMRTAASDECVGLGVLVVMDDQIHAARHVRKAHAHRPSAFASSSVGPIGWVVEDRVRVMLKPARLLPVLSWRGDAPRVGILTFGLGAGAAEVDAASAARPAGLIVAAAGSGHVPSAAVSALESLAKTIPIVFASRTGAGETSRRAYAFPGSESDLLARGLIGGGDLDPLKARILLILLLGEGAGRERIAKAFAA